MSPITFSKLASLPRSGRYVLAASALAFLTGPPPAISADWKGPGWYEIFYTADSGYMIWTGPYASEDVCVSTVTARYRDTAYAERMREKYGTFGDREKGFDVTCVELKTEADAPPD